MVSQRSLWMLIGGMCSIILFYFGIWQLGLALILITIVWIVIKHKYLAKIEEEKSIILDGSLLVVLGFVFIFLCIIFWQSLGGRTLFPLYIISLFFIVIGVNIFATIYGDDVMCMLFIGINLLSPVLLTNGLFFLSNNTCLDIDLYMSSIYLTVALWFFGLPAGVLGYYSNSKMLMNIMLGLWMAVMIIALFLIPIACGT